MQVQRVNYNTPTPSFKAINISKDVPENIKNAIETSKAFKKFGKRYNANVSCYTWSDNVLSRPMLTVSDIQPKTTLRRIIDKIRGIEPNGQFFYIFSHSGNTEKNLCNKLDAVPENYVLNRYIQASKFEF